MTLLRTLLLVIALVAGGRVAAAAEWVTAAPVEQSARVEIPLAFDRVEAPFVVIHGAPEHRRLLVGLSQHAARSYGQLADRLAVPLGDRVDVVIAPDAAAFRDLQPSPAPAHADGVAWPGLGYVLLRTPDQRGGVDAALSQVLDHELVHILMGRAFLPHRPPTWLSEGVAEALSGQAGPDNARRLLERRGGGDLPSLRSLSAGFPSDPLRAELAYAASADFVSWLLQRHGDVALQRLVRETAAGETIDSAIFTATGQTLDSLEAEWRAGWDRGVPGAGLLAQLDVLMLGGGGLALVVGGLARRRRFHQRLAEMEAEEAIIDALVAELHARRMGERAANGPDGSVARGAGSFDPRARRATGG